MVHSAVRNEQHNARRIVIVALALVFLVVVAGPDLRRCFGHPLGVVGVSFNYHAAVVDINATARAAGVRIGDRLDLQHAPPFERFAYFGEATADAGQRIQIPMLRGDQQYLARLTTTPESADRIQMVWLRLTIQLLLVILAVVVVLRRPSPATWGFFALMLFGCSPINDVYLIGPAWWRTIAVNIFWAIDVLEYGALIFALHLLHPGPLPHWRRVVQNLTIAFACITLGTSVWHANMLLFGTVPDPVGGLLTSILDVLPLFVAPVVLIGTYFESEPNVRQRLRWIIGGFVISTSCSVLDQAGSQGNLGIINESYVTHSLLTAGTYAFIAAPVAYAVLKHHIIDVNVAISRATVYTALSIFIVGAFALVDFFFSHALDQKSAGLVADVGLALLLGFSFNTLHRRVDSFVDSILFRKRHRAEEYLVGVAAAMAYARNDEHVRSMLAYEPARALDLSGARIMSAVATREEAPQTLCAYLQAKRGPVRLTGGEWQLSEFLKTDWVASVAVPVFSHGTLDAIVFYGVHKDATDLDAQEIALLERLGASAGAAFDRLEAEALRRENERLRQSELALSDLNVAPGTR